MNLVPLKISPDEVIEVILSKAKRKYGSDLLLVGAKGSLARGEFTKLSDFDMVIIVKNKHRSHWKEYLFNTTYIDINVITLSDSINAIKSLNHYWPAGAGGKLNLKVYYDPKNTKSKLKKAYDELKKSKRKFIDAIEINSFIEYYSKAMRYVRSKDYESLHWAANELAEEFGMILMLINQKYFTSQGPSTKIKQIKNLKIKPRGTISTLENLYSLKSSKNIVGVNSVAILVEKLRTEYQFKSSKIKELNEINF